MAANIDMFNIIKGDAPNVKGDALDVKGDASYPLTDDGQLAYNVYSTNPWPRHRISQTGFTLYILIVT